MDVVGKWKIVQTKIPGKGSGWVDVARLSESGEIPVHMTRMLSTSLLFEEDGTVSTIVPLPEGMPISAVKNAVDLGQFCLYDDAHTLEKSKYRWKEENGKLYFNTGTGAVVSEDNQSWIEITEFGGYLEIMCNRYSKDTEAPASVTDTAPTAEAAPAAETAPAEETAPAAKTAPAAETEENVPMKPVFRSK